MSANTNEYHRLSVGDKVPSVMGRTDEGTPISLADFNGRAIAVFLIGAGLTEIKQGYFRQIANHTLDFLKLECSPIAISTEPVKTLSSFREAEKLPYLLISDTSLDIHNLMVIPGQDNYGSWLVDSHGTIVSAIPHMNPEGQIQATLLAQRRVGER